MDLYRAGRAVQAGAAPSFLVRGGVPRMLDGASLPMGVLDSLVGAPRLRWMRGPGCWSATVLTDGSDWLMQQLQLCAKLGHTQAGRRTVVPPPAAPGKAG
ncbi:MAG: hypothetical protein ACLUFT_09900 [Gemmiger formicilis]|uniref:hypothetical protein n=1 Tax=Gemmiger formicilis TaxID=745368 RepID=UPI0039927ACA